MAVRRDHVMITLGGRPLDTDNNGGLHDTRLHSAPAGHTLLWLPGWAVGCEWTAAHSWQSYALVGVVR